MKGLTKIFRAFCGSAAVILIVFGLVGQPFAEDFNPDKPITSLTEMQVDGVPILYNDDLVNTPFTHGDGIQGTTEYRNINDASTWEYYRFCGNAGDVVTIQVDRTTSAMDPALMVAEGTTTDSTGIYAPYTCGPDMTWLGWADDNNGIPHGVGGLYWDPWIQLTLPSTGEYTLMVFDYIGLGPAPSFEIHVSGITPCAPHFSCSGFEPPFDQPLQLKQKVNRCIPLKIQLFHEGAPITDQDIESPPVVDVTFTDGVVSSDAVEFTEQMDALGPPSDGNAFRYDADSGHWINNLSTKIYTAPGTYTVRVLSGDDTSYIIDPSCVNEFIRLE